MVKLSEVGGSPEAAQSEESEDSGVDDAVGDETVVGGATTDPLRLSSMQ